MRGPMVGIVNGFCLTLLCTIPLLIIWIGSGR